MPRVKMFPYTQTNYTLKNKNDEINKINNKINKLKKKL